MGFSYRHTDVPDDWIFLSAELSAIPAAPEKIAERMAEIGAARSETQPVRSRTGGSTFKNPPGGHAWQLIDAAGCRGLTQGGAMVSEKHCNFLINTGDATAEQLESLGEEVRRRVRAHCGVDLQWEIKRVGIGAAGDPS
jgi:UDP-N-acetylmuramate dehydrogenase